MDVKKEAGTETPATEAAGTGASDGPKEDEKKQEKEAAFVKKALGPSDEQRKKEEAALAKDLQKDWQSWKEKTFGKKASEDMADEKAPKAWEHKSHQQWVKKTYKEALASDKEAASSSKRKDPPTPSPDFGGSSPEPSSAEPYDSLDKRDEKEASLDKREKKKLPLPEWVAVDWYRTIELSNGYLQKGALKALKDAGVRVWALSYCGLDRSFEVQQKYDGLLHEGLVDTISFTWSKTGYSGKVATLKNWGVDYLFDDSYEIVRECTADGVVCYWIGPPQNRRAEYDSYPDLAAAVQKFLEDHEPHRDWQ